jgi:predicted SnoaL-like aldol condensation-catalyzing enzyme
VKQALFFSVFTLSAAFTAVAQSVFPIPKSDVEAQNLQVWKLFSEEVLRNGRVELLVELLEPQYVRHDPDGTTVVSPAEFADQVRTDLEDNMAFTPNTISIDGNLLWVRWSGTTETEEGADFPFRGMQLFRFYEGKLAETWVLYSPAGHWSDN